MLYFVMFAVHEEVALMSSSYSEMRLLRTVYKQFFMPLHLFMFRYYEVQKASVVESFRYLQYRLARFTRFAFCLCYHTYVCMCTFRCCFRTSMYK